MLERRLGGAPTTSNEGLGGFLSSTKQAPLDVSREKAAGEGFVDDVGQGKNSVFE
jgi:hypothetical protein